MDGLESLTTQPIDRDKTSTTTRASAVEAISPSDENHQPSDGDIREKSFLKIENLQQP